MAKQTYYIRQFRALGLHGCVLTELEWLPQLLNSCRLYSRHRREGRTSGHTADRSSL